jgi:hypothetical protein
MLNGRIVQFSGRADDGKFQQIFDPMLPAPEEATRGVSPDDSLGDARE